MDAAPPTADAPTRSPTHPTPPASAATGLTGGCPFRIDPTAADLHGEATRLRAAGPAAPVELPGGVRVWSVTDPALVKRLVTDPRVSKDAHRHWPAYIRQEIPERWPLRIWVDVENALTAYGSDHTRLRRLIGSAFTARRVRGLAPSIERIAADLLDGIADTPSGQPVDLRARYAWVLPLMVINTMLGVPEELHDGFRSYVGVMFATDSTEEESAAAVEELYALLTTLVAMKRAAPGDDVTSALIEAHDDETDSRLSDRELLDSILLLIGGGHETTVNLIDHAIVNLLTHPDQLAALLDGRADWSDLVEETLRHQAPIANILMRFAVEDIHDAPTGLTFRRGDPLMMNYAAVGRDPGLHGAHPEAFDISRPTRRDHLSFGHGTHYCLGAELARLETKIALPALFARFPRVALAAEAAELTPLESFISNGHQRLPVLLDGPTGPAGPAGPA